jgi:hypothetical protein
VQIVLFVPLQGLCRTLVWWKRWTSAAARVNAFLLCTTSSTACISVYGTYLVRKLYIVFFVSLLGALRVSARAVPVARAVLRGWAVRVARAVTPARAMLPVGSVLA